jgi:hypothetical protein
MKSNSEPTWLSVLQASEVLEFAAEFSLAAPSPWLWFGSALNRLA